MRWLRTMMPAIVLALALAAAAQAQTVEAVTGGQYYHRAGHMEVDGVAKIPLAEAQARGLTPCPECSPPAVVEGAVRDAGTSPYFAGLLARRRAGVLWVGVPRTGGVALPDPEPPAAAPAPPAAPRAPTAAERAAAFPTELPVPGTGGLLKVPTFKGTGAIVPVPLPMGGYFVVEPPLPGK